MTADLPSSWHCDRTDSYRPTPDASARHFATYVHESGDVSVRVAPATLEATERPGYELSATLYPGLDIEEMTVVRTVTTYESCSDLAVEFMSLFDGRYEKPADAEDALEYAVEHVQPSTAHDAVVFSG
ncbi:hypothetical protein ACYJ1Y_00425 [Natrialbaceae archaeon A-gly3]